MNILIAYFSYSGHTQGIAEEISKQTGGTLFEIQPAEPYSSDYDTCEAQAKKETHDGYKPPLAVQCDSLDKYDIILLGTPNWFNTIAPPVATFLTTNDMTGKTIIPFCTNGGGGLGHIEADVRNLCKDSTILSSLSLYEDGDQNAVAKITEWIKKSELKI